MGPGVSAFLTSFICRICKCFLLTLVYVNTIYTYTYIYILHALHFNKLSKTSRFSDDLISYGKLFQILEPSTFRLLKSKLFWFHWKISKFNSYSSQNPVTFWFNLERFFIKLGFKSLFCKFQHVTLSICLHSLKTFLLLKVTLRKIS